MVSPLFLIQLSKFLYTDIFITSFSYLSQSKLDWASVVISSLFQFPPNDPHSKCHNGQNTTADSHPCNDLHVFSMTIEMGMAVCG